MASTASRAAEGYTMYSASTTTAMATLVPMYQRNVCFRLVARARAMESCTVVSSLELELLHEAPGVDVGLACVLQVVHGSQRHGESPAAFREVQRIDNAVRGHARITDWTSSIRHAAIAECGFDAIGKPQQDDRHLSVAGGSRVGIADDVRDDLADGGIEVRPPGGIWWCGDAALELGPELRQGRVDRGEVLGRRRQGDGDLGERLTRVVRTRRAHPQPSHRDAARDRGW